MVTWWKGAGGPRTKYNARHVRCELGARPHTHDSMAERNRCHVLHTRQDLGEIHGLMVHERFHLDVSGVRVTTYEADFSYTTPARVPGSLTRLVVEDVKGVRTREYLIKKALMKAIHGIEIQEVP